MSSSPKWASPRSNLSVDVNSSGAAVEKSIKSPTHEKDVVMFTCPHTLTVSVHPGTSAEDVLQTSIPDDLTPLRALNAEENTMGREHNFPSNQNNNHVQKPKKTLFSKVRNVMHVVHLKNAQTEKKESQAKAVIAKVKRAVRRLNIVRGFASNQPVLQQIQEHRLSDNPEVLGSLMLLLASDLSTAELVKLSFDPQLLIREVKRMRKVDEQDLQRDRKLKQMRMLQDVKFSGSVNSHMTELQSAKTREHEDHRLALGFGMTYQHFLKSISVVGSKKESNQILVARLIEVLNDADKKAVGRNSIFARIACIRCIHPSSPLITAWTIFYMLLLGYLATYGLFTATFIQNQTSCRSNYFDPIQWLDATVDLFFVMDVSFRCFLFGVEIPANKLSENSNSQTRNPLRDIATEQPDESNVHSNPSVQSGGSTILLEPLEVLRHYAKTDLAFDIVTCFPMQWVIMGLEWTSCSTFMSGNSLLFVRVIRVLRVIRVFVRIVRARKAVKRAGGIGKLWRKVTRRVTANLLSTLLLMAVVWAITHFWACLSWLLQSLDNQDSFTSWKEGLGIPAPADCEGQDALCYLINFSVTLQVLFTIQPYSADSVAEAIFSALSSNLSVILMAVLVSKILDIWNAVNWASNLKASNMSLVTKYLRANQIEGRFKNDVLDYCEFHYGDPFAEFENTFLDELPIDLQAQLMSRLLPGGLEKSSMLFRGASEAFVARLAVRMVRRPLRALPGQRIVEQGTFGDEMYLVKSGTVEVSMRDPRTKRLCRAALLKAGASFGEVALWIDTRRMATCRALDFCELYTLTRSDLNEVLNMYPENAFAVAAAAIVRVLRNEVLCPELRGISVEDSERLARCMAMEPVQLEDGDVLTQAGKPAVTAYLIRSGQLEIDDSSYAYGVVTADPNIPASATHEQTTLFVGMVELLSGRRPFQTWRARGQVWAYRLSAADFRRLFDAGPAGRKASLRLAALCARLHERLRDRWMTGRWARVVRRHIAAAQERAEGDRGGGGERGGGGGGGTPKFDVMRAAGEAVRRASVSLEAVQEEGLLAAAGEEAMLM